MSWLKRIVSKISVQGTEEAAEKVLNAMPMAPCLTAEPAPAASEPAAAPEDDNPFKQRRYFVKRGLYVDHEEETRAANVVDSAEEIADKHPVDLKTLFPKLSLR